MGRRKRAGVALILAMVLGVIVAASVGFGNAVAEPVLRQATLKIDQWPEGAPPLRVALLSDIHVGNQAMRPERLQRIVENVNAARPEVVLLAGDFIVGESRGGAAELALDLAPLAALRASKGVFAVLGNHDHWTDPEAIRRNLASAGVRTLENEAVRVGPITIVGIGDRFSGHDDIGKAVRAAGRLGGIAIAFTHSPDLSPDLPKEVAVLLAGHTHCGQMVAPLIGPIVRYHQRNRLYDPKYRCGRVNDRGRSTFVTAGVGPGAVPLRFSAMPDWWLIELTPGHARGSASRKALPSLLNQPSPVIG